jgi:hypothetical protein
MNGRYYVASVLDKGDIIRLSDNRTRRILEAPRWMSGYVVVRTDHGGELHIKADSLVEVVR